MIRPWPNTLVAVLAVALVGSQAVCACLRADASGQACHQAKQTQTPDPHACCRHTHNDGDSPSDDRGGGGGDPCGHCNLRQAAERVAAEHPAKAVSPFDVVCVLWAADGGVSADFSARPPAVSRLAEDVPIPPLLRDLFHSHCLLTN